MSRVDESHLDPMTIHAYAAQLVCADAETAIESHLICCERCRARIAAASAADDLPGVESCRLQGIWDAVTDVIDSPRQSLPTMVWLRLRSDWRWLGRFLARCVTQDPRRRPPVGRTTPIARRALVAALALLMVPLVMVISGSTSLFAHQPFDTVDPSGHRFATGNAARAAAHTSPSAAGTVAPCASGSTGCPTGGPPAAGQPLCAPADLVFTVNWLSGVPGHGTLRVANISGTACVLPTVIDVQPLGLPDKPPDPDRAVDSTPPSAYQTYHLYPQRPAESTLAWTPWCGAPASAAVRVEWSGGTAEVTGSLPPSPACPPGAGRPTMSSGQLRPAAVSRSGLKAL